MKKRFWIKLCLLLILPVLLFTVSCAKKPVQTTDAAVRDIDGDEAARLAAQKAEEARRQAEQAARLEEERLQDEEMDARRRVEQERLAAKRRFEFQDIYFSFDRSDLSAAAQAVLREKSVWLWENPSASVVIEGHCDERGTTEYNLALGERRAESAKRFLTDLGINPSRLTTVSYGEEKPLDPRHAKDAWAKNRRAHFVLK